jgi:hypothetical protein
MCVQYKQMYKESIEEPEKFWGKIADDFHWEQKVSSKRMAPLERACGTPCRAPHLHRHTLCRLLVLAQRRQSVQAWTLALSPGRPWLHNAQVMVPVFRVVVLTTKCSLASWCCMQWMDKHMDSNFDVRKGPIHTSWFKGGRTNLCYNCLDRNIERGLGDELCFIWEGNEPSACPC